MLGERLGSVFILVWWAGFDLVYGSEFWFKLRAGCRGEGWVFEWRVLLSISLGLEMLCRDTRNFGFRCI